MDMIYTAAMMVDEREEATLFEFCLAAEVKVAHVPCAEVLVWILFDSTTLPLSPNLREEALVWACRWSLWVVSGSLLIF